MGAVLGAGGLVGRWRQRRRGSHALIARRSYRLIRPADINVEGPLRGGLSFFCHALVR